MSRSQRSLKIQSTVLGMLRSRGQVNIATFMGVSEATVSSLVNAELKNTDPGTTHLTRLADLLAGCGLKVVPEEMRCYREESLAAILQLAKERMAQLESPEQLIWEEPAG